MTRIHIVLVVASCLWMGCGDQSRTVIAPDGSETTITADGDKGEVAIRGPDGEIVRVTAGDGDIPLPEGFPTDVPIYPSARVTTSSTAKNTMTVVLTTGDPANKVMAFYEPQLKANDWEVVTTMSMGEGSMLHVTKENRACSLIVGQSKDQTSISLTVVQE